MCSIQATILWRGGGGGDEVAAAAGGDDGDGGGDGDDDTTTKTLINISHKWENKCKIWLLKGNDFGQSRLYSSLYR